MSNKLTATATLINDKVKFSGVSRDNPKVIVDYVKPVGDGEGYTSLELFLISLATCSGTSLLSLLRKMGKHISGLEVTAEGERREEHPTYFKNIHLVFQLQSENTSDDEIEKALNISKESICPVWNMVKNNVDITFSWNLI
ncbi:MAG: OsmC family protein [Solirubrobacterales bacterium]